MTRFLVAPPGVLESVEVPDELEGVLRVRIYRASRATCHAAPPRRPTGPGALLAVGATREEALARADAAADRIRFVTADAEARLVDGSVRSTFLSFQPPAVGDEEIAAVAETIRSGWLTTGPRAAELERRIAEFLEAKHVLARLVRHGGAPPRAARASASGPATR